MMKRFSYFLSIFLLSLFAVAVSGFACVASASTGSVDIGSLLPLWSVLPFVGILLSIALMPLLTPHFWHHHFPKVSAFWALVFAIPFLFFYQGTALYSIGHIYIIDYIPFIILLWSLYTISGGIYVQGTLKGTPAVNVVLLLIGTLLASLVGTTGASMLLIRPVLRSNSWRKFFSSVISAAHLRHWVIRHYFSDFCTAFRSSGH
jgi:cytochrome b subunit of formate dehydrogenase